MTALDSLTLEYLRQSFGEKTFARAKGYLDRILTVETADDLIRAQVAGSAGKPYTLEIRFTPGRMGRTGIKSWCSCPLGGHCKHVAAVLIQLVGERPGSADSPDSPLQEWLARLREELRDAEEVQPPRNAQRLYYQLEWSPAQAAYGIRLYKGMQEEGGQLPASASEWNNLERALEQPPQFLNQADLPILRDLWSFCRPVLAGRSFELNGMLGAQIWQRMLATGRLLFRGRPLTAGAVRTAQLVWRVNEKERLLPRLLTEPASDLVLPLDPPCYVDAGAGQSGNVELALPAAALQQLFKAPPLAKHDIKIVARTMKDLMPQAPLPTAALFNQLRVVNGAPRAILLLESLPSELAEIVPHRRIGRAAWQDYAVAELHYQDVTLALDSEAELSTLPGGEVVRIKRRRRDEQRLRHALENSGLLPGRATPFMLPEQLPAGALVLPPEREWDAFIAEDLPKLQQAGWEIRYGAYFRHRLSEIQDWQAAVEDEGDGWLGLDMGIVVEGKRLPLAPMLAELFQRDPRWLDGPRIARIPSHEKIELFGEDGQVIRLHAERLKPLAATLLDLFDGRTVPERLRLSRLDAPRLVELADATRWQFKGIDAVQQLAQRLQTASGVEPVAPPPSFQGALRDYQRQGLAWLQYLRSHELSGILADDMGLGKTAQAIAHLLLEKEGGRMDRPCLIVLPTSLVFNWKSELARFAPSLSVLVLHGAERKQQFELIAQHDIVLTTYPLLWRDAGELAQFDYHLLILDEAQYVKNANSKSAAAIRRMRARHRLCLTGTPMENHLGELWAQFDFLMPGFLADSRSFNKVWRTPIEKQGDALRLQLLGKRLRPFILRRRKQDVVRELPPKSLIVRAVELEGAQRDLYETVRSAMDAQVRAEIAAKGLNRSQIVILDALLKLRQVCCDPRLLKSSHARKISQSAKLELLLDMVPEMVEEGRRILIFSQFTEMLTLIEEALGQASVRYVKLTGQTRDRETPVRQFQAGEVPVFLISLKAGGVGLNLTAADTVIHYDPWWNPAAEEQATDRAHRLGQNKAVFVYKLTVAGSIEERMLALQAQKAQLASGILGKDESVEMKFNEADIAALLAPLPGI